LIAESQKKKKEEKATKLIQKYGKNRQQERRVGIRSKSPNDSNRGLNEHHLCRENEKKTATETGKVIRTQTNAYDEGGGPIKSLLESEKGNWLDPRTKNES